MQIYSDMIPVSTGDYDRTLQGYVAEVAQLPAVTAVFQFGSISEPGISDLDVLVVVRDDVSASSLHQLMAATKQDATSRYLFIHPPIVVPAGTVRDVAYLHNLDNLRQVWGEPIEIAQPSPADSAALRLAEYVDFSFANRTLLRGVERRPVGLRGLLLLLTSCVHSLHRASAITGRPLAGGIADRVARLRERSPNGQEAILLSAGTVAADCAEAMREADRTLEAVLQSRELVRPAPGRECVYHPDGHFYIFETPFRGRRSAADTFVRGGRLLRVLGADPSIDAYPGFHLAQFAAYGEGTGAYATAHRAFFHPRAADAILDPTYRRVLVRRCRTAQDVYDVVSRGGLTPMAPLGIGFRTPDRIKVSKRRRVLRALVARRAASGKI